MADNQITEARETYVTLLNLSRLLNTGLEPETLTICVRLCEAGVNPESLAAMIRELRKESAKVHDNEGVNDGTIHNN